MGRFLRLAIASSIFALFAIPTARAGEDEPVESQPKKHPFTAAMEYMVRDGGQWAAPNPDYEKGEDQPHSFTYSFSWTLGGHVARNQIGGIYDDGRAMVYWEDLISWDPREKKIRIYQVGYNGSVLDGYETIPADGRREARLEGFLPDGSSLTFRDVVEEIGPDEHRSVSYHLIEGEWVKRNELRWTRVSKQADHDK